MDTREITALRKSGRLTEALEAAEKEFAQNTNTYTVNALFWCLNDLYRQQVREDAIATIERMKSLYDSYCTGDDFMSKALERAFRWSLPHYQDIKNAVENAKHGADAIAACRQTMAWNKEGNLDERLFQDFGWLIYYALKQLPVKEIYEKKLFLSQYFELNLPCPSILHSLILGEAVKLEHETPLQFRIRDFIRLWGLENLRDEDWNQYRTANGNVLPSLVEKLIGVYSKELKTDGVESPEEFSQLVDKALEKYPNNQNMPYFKAIVLISQGKSDEALAYYKELILRFPSKFYLWDQTSDLAEDADIKIGLLCKALLCRTEDEFVGSVRLKLATLLISKGLTSDAKYELEKYLQTYKAKGWNLKSDFWQIYNQLPDVEANETNNGLYALYAIKADAFIYSSLPASLAIKVAESQSDDRNRPGRRLTTWILRMADSTVRLRKPSKFGLKKHTLNGSAFDVKIRDSRIVWIKEHTDAISASWIKEQIGKVRIRTDRNGRKYAIVAGSYVGESLLKDCYDGQEIKILSIQQKDGRWSAISLLNA